MFFRKGSEIIIQKYWLQMVIRNDEVCLGKTRVLEDESAEKKKYAEIAVKMYEFQRNNGHVAAVISASPKAVMMASMLRLEVLVDGWR